jgi:hypothetical protein
LSGKRVNQALAGQVVIIPVFDIYPEAPQLSEIVRGIAPSITHPALSRAAEQPCSFDKKTASGLTLGDRDQLATATG